MQQGRGPGANRKGHDMTATDTLAIGQTFRQRGGRLLHIFVGDVTRTDRGGNVLYFSGAACGASYQPEKGDRAEESDRKVCATCSAAYVAPVATEEYDVVVHSGCGLNIPVGTPWTQIRDRAREAGCKFPEACADDVAYWCELTDGADE